MRNSKRERIVRLIVYKSKIDSTYLGDNHADCKEVARDLLVYGLVAIVPDALLYLIAPPNQSCL